MAGAPELHDTQHPRYSRVLRRPVTALMLLVLIVVLGVVAYHRIPLMLMPEGASRPVLSVEVDYPESSPTEVCEKVTRPLEDELRMLPNVTEIRSRSQTEGTWIRLEFDPDTDMDVAYAEVKDRVERVRPTLPDGVGEVSLRRRGSDSEMPIFYFDINYEEDVEDPFGTIEDVIQPRLEAVDGVAQVQVWGMVQDSVRAFVRPERLRAFGLSFYDVVARLRRDNFALPAGAIDEAGREFLLRIDSTFDSLDEVRDYPLSESVRLGDVADVRLAKSYRDYVSRVNGRPSVFGWIAKESDANTVATCALVRDQFATLGQDPRLDGFTFNVFFDQSEMIEAAVENLQGSAAWGALFAVIVLYLFVRRIALTLMVALAIPVSLTAALVGCYFFGISFNVISLAGFTIAVGMLVDNSIVVAENIVRKRAEGASPAAAACGGAAQVGLAIVLSTLTTIAMFLPMVFMASDKNAKIMLRELAFPITFSLIASLLVALVFLPIATVLFANRRAEAAGSAHVASAYTGHSRMLRGYRGALGFLLRHRFGSTVGVLAVLWLGSLASAKVETNVNRRHGDEQLSVDVELPRRFTLEEASDVFAELEEFVLARKDEYKFEDMGVDFDRQGGDVNLWFEKSQPESVERDLSNKLREDLPRIPGVRYRVGFQGGEDDGVRVQLIGPDSRMLTRLAEDVLRELEAVETLVNMRTDNEDAWDEMRIGIDRDRAQRFGVRPEELQGLIAWGVGGQRLPSFRAGSREIPMLIEYEEPLSGDLEYLKSLEVPVADGGSIPLAAFTTFSIERSFGAIFRQDGVTYLGLVGESLDMNSFRVSRRVAEAIERVPFPDGYTWREGGRRPSFEEEGKELQNALLVGIVFVFLLMGMLFESSILPLSVLLAIPPALIGAFVALFLARTAQDETSQLAPIILAGIVVNNGIVLVDRIRQLRDGGLARRDAVLTGCEQRVRPVLMTALTTMCGLLPMALPGVFGANDASAINYQAMSIAVLGGLTLSTILTLFVVPLFYTLFDDLSLALRGIVSGRKKAEGLRLEA